MRQPTLGCMVLILAGCGMEVEAGDIREPASTHAPGVAASTSATTASASASDAMLLVDVANVQPNDVVTALLYSDRDARLSARIDGVVEEIMVELGDAVRAGDVLARLDDRREAARLRSAAAAVELATAEHVRASALHEQVLITAADFETSLYRLRTAQAELQAVQVELGYTRITAPFDGVVTSRMTGVGRSVTEGEPLFRLTALRPLRVLVRLTETEARTVERGALVQLVHGDGSVVNGRIERISAAVDPESGTVEVLVSVPEPGSLRPGSMVQVHFESSGSQ